MRGWNRPLFQTFTDQTKQSLCCVLLLICTDVYKNWKGLSVHSHEPKDEIKIKKWRHKSGSQQFGVYFNKVPWLDLVFSLAIGRWHKSLWLLFLFKPMLLGLVGQLSLSVCPILIGILLNLYKAASRNIWCPWSLFFSLFSSPSLKWVAALNTRLYLPSKTVSSSHLKKNNTWLQ